MTKREYMQKLSRALEGYEQGFVQEILESYEEHFEGRLFRLGRLGAFLAE